MKANLVSSMPVGAWIYEIKFDNCRLWRCAPVAKRHLSALLLREAVLRSADHTPFKRP
jgi:hypothetical protein